MTETTAQSAEDPTVDDLADEAHATSTSGKNEGAGASRAGFENPVNLDTASTAMEASGPPAFLPPAGGSQPQP